MTEASSPSRLEADLRAKIAGKAKPMGALGRLEDLAVQIGLVTGSLAPNLGTSVLLIFAGDHGLTAEGVTAYPSTVTGAIARLVMAGTAGASICATAVACDVCLVDAGLLQALPEHPLLRSHRIAPGTRNARREPAMVLVDYQRAFDAGQAAASEWLDKGVGIFALGEIGIGNSSAAALVAHAVTDLPLATLVGPGAGLPKGGMTHKLAVLTAAFARAFGNDIVHEPRKALIEFAGFEMVMMAGALSRIAKAKRMAIIDGFIATSVAAALFAIEPEARAACVFAHASGEPGHKALLAKLGASPLFDLGLRLGEGTGAALAIPFVRAAERMLTDLADLPGGHPG